MIVADITPPEFYSKNDIKTATYFSMPSVSAGIFDNSTDKQNLLEDNSGNQDTTIIDTTGTDSTKLIFDRVKKIIMEKLGVDEEAVTAEASFTNDLGADSLDTVELIMEFEKEFNISIPDEDAEKIATVGQAITYLEKRLYP